MSNNNKVFYETLFKQNSSKTNIKKQVFLSSLDIKTSTNQQSNIWENEIWETDLFDSRKYKKQQNSW